MRTLITGASGFIGSHLVRHLIKSAGEEIVTIGRSKGPGGTRHFNCELSNFEDLKTILSEYPPDTVYHFAGLPQRGDKVGFPQYFEANSQTTMNLLEAMDLNASPMTFFFPSTVHVYGIGQGDISEEFPPAPQGDYAFSKYLAEEALRHHATHHPKFRAIVSRIADCGGPGQNQGFPLSDACGGLANGESLRRDHLKTMRGFIDVRDLVKVARGLAASKRESGFEVFNVAGPERIGAMHFLTQRLSQRLTLHLREFDQSLKDFQEWYRRPRP